MVVTENGIDEIEGAVINNFETPAALFNNRAEMLAAWDSLPEGSMAVYPGGLNGPVVYRYQSLQAAQADWANIPEGALIIYPKA